AKHTREDFGDAGNRCWIEHAVADDAQTALALGDEHRSIGKKREAPRMRESSRHWHDANWRLATEERLRQWRCRRRRTRRLPFKRRNRRDQRNHEENETCLAEANARRRTHRSGSANAVIVLPDAMRTCCRPSSMNVTPAAPQIGDPVR